ncbi:hypothetical protein M422DRAFT_243478 [Sphaerobolus stellatus SS14]|nr:hypothetical protein M422DRAFT_243478 [Sphaerobolus stellatus SS14]
MPVFSTTRHGGRIPENAIIPILSCTLSANTQRPLLNVIHSASITGIILGVRQDSTVDAPELIPFEMPRRCSPEELTTTCANDGISLPFCFCILNISLILNLDDCRSQVRFITLASGRQVYALVCHRGGHYVACSYNALLVQNGHGMFYNGYELAGQVPLDIIPGNQGNIVAGPSRHRNTRSAPAPYPPRTYASYARGRPGPGPPPAPVVTDTQNTWPLVNTTMMTWLSVYGTPLDRVRRIMDRNVICLDCNFCFGTQALLTEHQEQSFCPRLRQVCQGGASGGPHGGSNTVTVIE